MSAVCAIGKRDDGTLRVCCSSHGHLLCARHYARSHFVETSSEWAARPCNADDESPALPAGHPSMEGSE